MVCPEQMVCEGGEKDRLMMPGFTLMMTVMGFPGQEAAVGVTVYVTV